ncbi:MAG TPA: PqiC family protein [Dyella sp.]|uniref:PqiC family protein n=1 Tax=Dyella sp. TaxID=1869338 RepID=UPI002C339CCF|nr:PqiC family protein [Dyella sp.]HUB91098.1 PqiC family protein [Dyella sp.]
MTLRPMVIILAAALTACGHSPPTRYVTLNAEPVIAPRVATQMQPVQLTAVHIPAELDRPEVVTQDAANRLTIHDTDRWGAPLGQMMRRTLAQDLLARLPAGAFVLPDAPAPPHTRILVVTVLNAEADASGTLTMQVSWTLLSGHPAHTELRQQLTLSSSMPSRDATAQAAAMSHVLGQLADRIAAAVVTR